METAIIKVETEHTGDAERDAIGFIPQVLKDLSQDRAIAVLEYMLGRYKSGDTFGMTK